MSRSPRWATSTVLVPVLFGTGIFVGSALILVLLGAFSLRVLMGASYASSAMWVGVVAASLVLAVLAGVLARRHLAAGVLSGSEHGDQPWLRSSDDHPALSRPAARDPNAVAALAFAALSIPLYFVVLFSVSAVLLGGVTWRRRRTEGLPDSKMVTAALVLGAVSLGAVVVQYTSHAITIATEDAVRGDQLRVGDCWKIAEGPGPVARQDCAGRHRWEVFAIIDDPSPPGVPYPGVEALHARGRTACEPRFPGYAGRPLDTSELEVIASVPTETRWNQGSRRMDCSVGRRNGMAMAGSVKGPT